MKFYLTLNGKKHEFSVHCTCRLLIYSDVPVNHTVIEVVNVMSLFVEMTDATMYNNHRSSNNYYVKSHLDIRFRSLRKYVGVQLYYIYFQKPRCCKHLPNLHDMYVIAPADKAPNNMFVHKQHCITCSVKELDIDN